MDSNITKSDVNLVINFLTLAAKYIKVTPGFIFSSFEKQLSKWLGVKL